MGEEKMSEEHSALSRDIVSDTLKTNGMGYVPGDISENLQLIQSVNNVSGNNVKVHTEKNTPENALKNKTRTGSMTIDDKIDMWWLLPTLYNTRHYFDNYNPAKDENNKIKYLDNAKKLASDGIFRAGVFNDIYILVADSAIIGTAYTFLKKYF